MLFFTFGKGLQLSIAGLVTALYVYSLGFDKTFVGIFLGVPSMGALISAVPMGILADKIGRKPLLLIGGLLNPLALVWLALSTQAPMLIAASLANGLLSNAYWVTSLPILTESTTQDQRVGVLAANNFLMLGVGAAGSLVGGVVTNVVAQIVGVPPLTSVPLRWGILIAALVTFIPVFPLFWMREPKTRRMDVPEMVAGVVAQPDNILAQETAAMILASAVDAGPDSGSESKNGHEPAHMNGAQAGSSGDAASEEPIDPQTRIGVVLLFAKLFIPDTLYTAGSGAALALLSIYFVSNFHLDPESLGIFLAIEGVLGGSTAFLAPRVVRRFGKLKTATTVQYLSLPVILAIGFARVFPLAAGAEVTRNALRGIFDPTYAAFTMEQVSRRYRATLSGGYSVTWSVGFTAGAGAAGWLYQYHGYGAAVTLSAVLIATSATLLRLWFGKRRATAKLAESVEREAAPAQI